MIFKIKSSHVYTLSEFSEREIKRRSLISNLRDPCWIGWEIVIYASNLNYVELHVSDGIKVGYFIQLLHFSSYTVPASGLKPIEHRFLTGGSWAPMGLFYICSGVH